MSAVPSISLREAFKEAIQYSGGDTAHKSRQQNFAEHLADFWETPLEVHTLCQARNSHVKRYIEHRVSRGHSPNTIRQAVNPVRLLNNWVLDELNPDWRPLEVSRFLRDIAPRTAPDHTFLSLDQLVECIRIAADNDKPAALLALTVCGLTGMRITELERRTAKDLHGDEIRIASTTKNDSSRRVIPVCGLVRQVFEEHFEHFGGGGRWGGSGEMYRYKTFWTQVRWVLDHATERTGNARFAACTPHEAGRTTFENFAKEFCANKELLDAYTGRAPVNVRQKHYANSYARPTMLAEINEEKISTLRTAIVEPLERKLRSLEI